MDTAVRKNLKHVQLALGQGQRQKPVGFGDFCGG